MSPLMHPDELEVDEPVVRRLLAVLGSDLGDTFGLVKGENLRA
jgi:hypothetical protein